MQDVKKELDSATFEIASSDGLVKIKMNGSQEVQDVIIKEDAPLNSSVLSQRIKDTFNRAIKRSHELAAEKMKNVTGLNLPGM